MFSGKLSQQTLLSLFRLLSLKKRHGILEVHTRHYSYQVVVMEGLFEQIVFPDNSEVKMLLKRLVYAGVLKQDAAKKLLEYPFVDCVRLILKHNLASSVEILSAKRSYEYDLLHLLWKETEGDYSFNAQVIALSDDYLLRASPTQILLDYLEQDEIEIEAPGKFGDNNAQIRTRAFQPSIKLQASEQRIWKLLSTGTTLGNLLRVSLLPELEVKRCLQLFALHDLVESIFENVEQGSMDFSLGGSGINSVANKPSAAEQEEDLIERAAQMLLTVDDEAAAAAMTEVAKHGKTQTAIPVIKQQQEEAPLPPYKHQTWAEQLEEFQQSLISGQDYSNSALLAMIVFMFTVGLFVPGYLNNWFEALSKFTH
ncbi:MAG: hypothetical protein IT292_10620 [Deltaproteobacteria bacterium]|nr:hypothetical protein [Deltaproteobacteria bacterium]